DAAQVDVALDGGLDLGQGDAARRRDVGDAGGQAARERVQDELDGRRALVGAAQHRGVIAVVLEVAGVRVLAAGAEEGLHLAAAVRAAEPAVRGAEAELGELGLPRDGADRGEERGGVDAVARRRGLSGRRGLGVLVHRYLRAAPTATSVPAGF